MGSTKRRRELFVVACIALLSACSHFPCDREKVSDTTSPNHQLTATLLYIECGAIGKDHTWVTLHETGKKYDRSNEIIFEAVQQNRVEIEWKDNSHLSIYCRCRDEDVRFQVIKKGVVTISYK
jgi:hypothetical protein